MNPRGPLTLGVEEEFLLVEPATGEAAPVVDEVAAALDEQIRAQLRREFHASQVELATTVCTDLGALREEISGLRRATGIAAATVGCQLLAVGTAPVHGAAPPITDEPRYARMAEHYGAIADTPGLCGCHVHVGVPDRALAIEVCNRLRPWLPTLQAMTANSPFARGRDTGHASWRSVLWGRWPSTGPTPYFESPEHYKQTVDELIRTGIMLDEGMVYWYARPSVTYPTVEVRVGDVCPTAAEATLTAGLTRALVATIADDVRDGRAALEVSDRLLRSAHWRAARDGLEGAGVDLATGDLCPAWDLVDRLVDRVDGALRRHDDLETVHALVDDLRRDGCGAARQRQARQDGGLREVFALLRRQTTGDG